MEYQSPSKGALSETEVAQEITAYVDDRPECTYSIVVGTDSESGVVVDFITAIVVHRVGHGGRYFWKRMKHPRYATLRERIWQETLFSIATAHRLLELLGEEERERIEIHIDVGENGPTKHLIHEVTGMVRGNGFTPRIKPEAYAAAAVADRLV